MKHLLLFVFSIALVLSSSAQSVDDAISMSPGYVSQSFYSMAEGEVLNIDNTDWDIAFMTDAFNTSVIVNDNVGTALYLYSTDVEQWASVDTTGMDWTQLYNSETEWERGAFSQLATEDAFDYGWGYYNLVTHVVNGNKIFIIALNDGSLKKIMVNELAMGTYTFTYADLDGSNEVSEVVNSADYATKNFWYYSLSSSDVIDREPATASWDITFTRYNSEIFPGTHYLVAGVLSNIGVEVAQADDVTLSEADWTDYSMSSDINIIGSDWKFFDNGTFQFLLEEERSYFVKDLAGNVWHLVFTGFEGTASGNVEFTKELVSVTSVEESQKIDFSVFPNPAADQATITLNLDGLAQWQLLDQQGRVVEAGVWNSGFVHDINLSAVNAGHYVLQITDAAQRIGHRHLIVK